MPSSTSCAGWSASTAARTRATGVEPGRRLLRRCAARARRDGRAHPAPARRGAAGRPGDRPPRRRRAALLLIGHMDTVFEPGTAAARPFRIGGSPGVRAGRHRHEGRPAGRLPRPGGLQAAGARPTVTYVCNPDEEIGSPFSTLHIRELGRQQHDAGVRSRVRPRQRRHRQRAQGRSPTSRSTVTGRAAHAGVEPEKGRSAILEAAHKVVALHELNGRWPSVTRQCRRDRGRDTPQRGGGALRS